MDIFSIPEMTLLAVANDYFITNDIEYDPVHLFKDVSVSESSQWQTLLLISWSVGLGRIPGQHFLWFTVFIQLDAQESAELSQTWLSTLLGRTENSGNRFFFVCLCNRKRLEWSISKVTCTNGSWRIWVRKLTNPISVVYETPHMKLQEIRKDS